MSNDTGHSDRVLGKPQAGISLRIVQGDTTIPLVLVDANDDYRFVVRATVPAELASWPAIVTASSVRPGEFTDAIVITDTVVPGVVSAPPTILVGRDSTAPRVEVSDGNSHTRWVVAGVFVAVVVAAIVGVILFRRQQSRPHQWIQAPRYGHDK